MRYGGRLEKMAVKNLLGILHGFLGNGGSELARLTKFVHCYMLHVETRITVLIGHCGETYSLSVPFVSQNKKKSNLTVDCFLWKNENKHCSITKQLTNPVKLNNETKICECIMY